MEPTNTLDSEDTRKFIEAVTEYHRDPKCPKCLHKVSDHKSKFVGRNSVESLSTTKSECSFVNDTPKYDSISSVWRIANSKCACDMRPDEIKYNLQVLAKANLRKLDNASDGNFRVNTGLVSKALVVRVDPPFTEHDMSTTDYMKWLIGG